MYLLDSNILVYHLNGEKIATDFIAINKELCSISIISYIEVLSFDFSDTEEKLVTDFLNTFTIYETTKEIAEQAVVNRKSKKIKVPDNIIASTAQVHDLILITRNSSDFLSLDLDVIDIFSM